MIGDIPTWAAGIASVTAALYIVKIYLEEANPMIPFEPLALPHFVDSETEGGHGW